MSESNPMRQNGRCTGRWGHRRYAEVLAMLHRGPSTPAEIAAAQQTSVQTARELLWRMESLGLCRVSAWREPVKRSSYLVPVFSVDPGVSLPYPRRIAGTTIGTCRKTTRPELIAFAHVVRLLRAGATRLEVHEQTGIAYLRVSLLLREMRRLGIVHITEWRVRDSGGVPAQVFCYGPGKDAKRPAPRGRQEIQRRNREGRQARAFMTQVSFALAAGGAA